MTDGEFFYLLLGASYHAYKFGKQFVKNDLSPEFKYDVYLGCSRDTSFGSEFQLYPDEVGKIHFALSDVEVTNLLVRDSKVPVWINVAIYKEGDGFTLISLICAGRFSDKSEELYYTSLGSGPFGVKGPTYPTGWIGWLNNELFELPKI